MCRSRRNFQRVRIHHIRMRRNRFRRRVIDMSAFFTSHSLLVGVLRRTVILSERMID